MEAWICLISAGPQFLPLCSGLGWGRSCIIPLGQGPTQPTHPPACRLEAGEPAALGEQRPWRQGEGDGKGGLPADCRVEGGRCGEAHPLTCPHAEDDLPCHPLLDRVQPPGAWHPLNQHPSNNRPEPPTHTAPGWAQGTSPSKAGDGEAQGGQEQLTLGLWGQSPGGFQGEVAGDSSRGRP